MNKFYTIKQFSKLSGFSVRMLHYYDQINLLKPYARDSNNGYRRYLGSDLLKAQQIQVLKFIGYDLAKIVKIVADKDLDLSAVLSLQYYTTSKQIDKLDQSLQLIKQMQSKLMQSPNRVNWEEFALLSKGVNMEYVFDYNEWLNNYFNAEELKEWQELRIKFSHEYWLEYGRKWQDLFKRIEPLMNMDPACEPIQKMVKEWEDLVDSVYAGHPKLKEKTWEALKSGVNFIRMEYFNQEVVDYIAKAAKYNHKK